MPENTPLTTGSAAEALKYGTVLAAVVFSWASLGGKVDNLAEKITDANQVNKEQTLTLNQHGTAIALLQNQCKIQTVSLELPKNNTVATAPVPTPEQKQSFSVVQKVEAKEAPQPTPEPKKEPVNPTSEPVISPIVQKALDLVKNLGI